VTTYIEEYLYNNANEIPMELSYKFNLLLDELIMFNLKKELRYNANKYIYIIMSNKILFIDKYIDVKSFYYYGLTYENLFELLTSNMIHSKLKDKLIEYKIFLAKSLEKIESDNNAIIDPIFSIEVTTPCMIPHSDELYELYTMKLLCRETSKNPLTREQLTLKDLFEYNNLDTVKNEIKNIIEKTKI
jgi:hypothetical protein